MADEKVQRNSRIATLNHQIINKTKEGIRAKLQSNADNQLKATILGKIGGQINNTQMKWA